MISHKTAVLNHIKSVKDALEPLGASVSLNLLDFKLTIRFGFTEVLLYPQFTERVQGKWRYTPVFRSRVRGFIGWLPYFNKRWPLSSEKLEFKKFAVMHGLPTPDYSVDPACEFENVIVKRSISSFGAEIRGPFRKAGQHPLDTANGEYYERFIQGRITKIWFWNAEPVCLEFQHGVTITGDGVHSVRQLLIERDKLLSPNKSGDLPFHYCHDFLEYQGKSVDSIPASGKQVGVDFRYGSPFVGPAPIEDVNLRSGELSLELKELKARFVTFGKTLEQAIPENIRKNCVFTVDAIMDGGGKVWLLEMNSNPFLHPWVYSAMLNSIADDVKHKMPIAPMPPGPMHADIAVGSGDVAQPSRHVA